MAALGAAILFLGWFFSRVFGLWAAAGSIVGSEWARYSWVLLAKLGLAECIRVE
jgi:hypothetical protein